MSAINPHIRSARQSASGQVSIGRLCEERRIRSSFMYTRSEFSRAERDPANYFSYDAPHDAKPGHLFIQLNVVGREESAGSMVFAQPPIVVGEFLIFELACDIKLRMRKEAEVSEYIGGRWRPHIPH